VRELSVVAQGSRRAETDTECRGQAASPAPSAENPKVTVTVSVHREGIVENFNVFDFRLSPEDMAAIAIVDTKTSSFLTTVTRMP
jgi:hypothetical protein